MLFTGELLQDVLAHARSATAGRRIALAGQAAGNRVEAVGLADLRALEPLFLVFVGEPVGHAINPAGVGDIPDLNPLPLRLVLELIKACRSL